MSDRRRLVKNKSLDFPSRRGEQKQKKARGKKNGARSLDDAFEKETSEARIALWKEKSAVFIILFSFWAEKHWRRRYKKGEIPLTLYQKTLSLFSSYSHQFDWSRGQKISTKVDRERERKREAWWSPGERNMSEGIFFFLSLFGRERENVETYW